jgi:hypothetical protein
MPRGFLSCTSVRDAEGRPVPLRKAIEYGWLQPSKAPAGFGIGPDEVPLGRNLFLDAGRQYMAYAWGFRPPVSNYAVQYFGIGTGTATPAVSDTALQNPVAFDGAQQFLKLVDTVDFPAPFIARVLFTIGATEANGYLLTEFGLYSGDQTLITRLTRVGINKTSDFAPQLAHRVRF